MLCIDCQSVLPPAARFCPGCGAQVPPPETEPVDPIGAALKSNLGFLYRIERSLGRGGMGAVYLAHEFALDRDVAIKVLPPEQAMTPRVRERFRREARTAARLSHPNIVPLHTFGEVGGLMYFVMGYVAGESLGPG
jgi:serine/threonine protein kinase